MESEKVKRDRTQSTHLSPLDTPEERIQISKNKILKNVKINKLGCWIWQGLLDRLCGFGRLTVSNHNWYAHRFAYHVFVEPLDEEESVVIGHKCGERTCCNPDHLYVTFMPSGEDHYKWKSKK